MAKTVARNGALAIATDGLSGTYNNVAGVSESSLSLERDDIDASDFDSVYKAHEYGEVQHKISGTVNLDGADTASAAIMTAFNSGVKYHARYRFNVAGGALQWRFQFVVTSFNISLARNGMVQASFELMSDGTVTRDTQ